MPELATLSERGQIVIPQDVRKEMHLKPGNRFVVFPMDDSIILKKLEIPTLDRWDAAMKPLRAEARRKGITEKDVGEMVQRTRRGR